VLGLTRSDAGARALTDAGVEVHRGDLQDLESLRRGAANADAVIHLAFNHDFSKFVANCEDDRRVIEALGAELAGTNKLLIVTSGTAMAKPGRANSVRRTIRRLARSRFRERRRKKQPLPSRIEECASPSCACPKSTTG
jgi:nucleoside-diphosphate-sugar epimerase